MKRNMKKPDWVRFCIFADTLMLLLTVALFIFCMAADDSIKGNGTKSFASEWYYDRALSKPADLKHPDEKGYGAGSAVDYYAKLPDGIKDGDGIMFRVKNGEAFCFVGNETDARSSFELNGQFYGKAGTGWVCLPVYEKDCGNILHIRFTPSYDSSCYISSFMCGKIKDIVTKTVSGLMPGAITSFLIFVVGIALITAYSAFRIAGANETDLLCLGLASVAVSIWSLGETKILQVFTDNAGAVHNLGCMALSLICPPLVMVFREKRKADIVLRVACLLSVIQAGFVYVLHFTEIADFHETLDIVHIVQALCAVSMFLVNLAACIRQHHMTKRDISAAVGIMLIAVCGVMDILGHEHFLVSDNSRFTRIAVLIFIVMLSASSLEHGIGVIKKGMHADFVSRLAYEDGLTGLSNRTAYNEKLEQMEKGGIYTLFMFDVNHLKYVNDNIGHAAGDTLITRAAEVINSSFKEHGQCYRIGGDEFCCICDGRKDCRGLVKNFYETLEKDNLENPGEFPLVIASGAGIKHGETGAHDAMDTADKNMYRCKHRLKEKYPLDSLIGWMSSGAKMKNAS